MATKRKVSITHGTCTLLAYKELTIGQSLDTGDAVLILDTKTRQSYEVLRLRDDKERVVGFRLKKMMWYIVDTKTYDIYVCSYAWRCDCPDAEYHGHECKHARALRAALKSCGELPNDNPQPQRYEEVFDDP